MGTSLTKGFMGPALAGPPYREDRAMRNVLLSIVSGVAVLVAGRGLAQEVGGDAEDKADRMISGPYDAGRGGFDRSKPARTCTSARNAPGTAPEGGWWFRPEMGRR